MVCLLWGFGVENYENFIIHPYFLNSLASNHWDIR
jgi:hypothetical protein